MSATLPPDWLTHGLVDFEYKKYVLLAYLQQVEHHFSQVELYPHLAELVDHYQRLVNTQQQKQQLEQLFPKVLKGLDADKLQLAYETSVQDDELMQELDAIIAYAIPTLQGYLAQGRSIFDWVVSLFSLSPIGLEPLDVSHGYLMMFQKTTSLTKVYAYHTTVFEHAHDHYKGLSLNHLVDWQWSLALTHEQMKLDLLKSLPMQGHPAAYLLEVKSKVPEVSTLIPVAKRFFLGFLASKAGIS